MSGRNPVPGSVAKFGRIDQGVDLNLSTSGFVAPWSVKVLEAIASSPGWGGGGWLAFELLEGPCRGQGIYVAEGAKLLVGLGTFAAGTKLCDPMTNPINGAFGNVEIGWVAPNAGESLARTLPGYSGDQSLQAITCGMAMQRFITALGGPTAPNLSGLQPNYALLPSGLAKALDALEKPKPKPEQAHASGQMRARVIVDWDKPVGHRLSVEGVSGTWHRGTDQADELMQLAADPDGSWRIAGVPNNTKPLG